MVIHSKKARKPYKFNLYTELYTLSTTDVISPNGQIWEKTEQKFCTKHTKTFFLWELESGAMNSIEF